MRFAEVDGIGKVFCGCTEARFGVVNVSIAAIKTKRRDVHVISVVTWTSQIEPADNANKQRALITYLSGRKGNLYGIPTNLISHYPYCLVYSHLSDNKSKLHLLQASDEHDDEGRLYRAITRFVTRKQRPIPERARHPVSKNQHILFPATIGSCRSLVRTGCP